MLDIKFIKENKELIAESLKKRRKDFDLEKLLSTEEKRIAISKEVDDLRAKQNEANETIAKADPKEKEELVAVMSKVKDELQGKEEKLKEIMKDWQDLMIAVPNIPDMSVPEGDGEKDNKEELTWGDKPEFKFKPKDHMTLMRDLDMADFERGSKVHGFRGYFLKNDGALLSFAVWRYAQDFFLDKGFNPFIAPAIVKKEFFYATGHLPTDAEDLFKTQDDDYLSGTSEVPMMAYHSDEILKKEELPKRYLAFSPCYRREIGSYNKDVKGLIRVHEFYKLEQLILCEASHEESVKFHEEINRNTEEFIESLGIPYRRLAICTGDLKSSHVKSYDTDVWVPSQDAYREIASTSYYHDFQARRFNIRYDDSGKKRYVHSLNGTAAPTPRLLVPIIENNQQEDGSIKIPKVLQKYLGKEIIS